MAAFREPQRICPLIHEGIESGGENTRKGMLDTRLRLRNPQIDLARITAHCRDEVLGRLGDGPKR